MTIIKNRRGTSSQWSESNPVLAQGEQGFEIDTGRFKYGDGVKPWSQLPYFDDETRTVKSRPNTLISVLERDVQDAVLLLAGDSTGNEEVEWFYKTVQALASQFPRYKVLYHLWNDANQSYSAATTLQAGSGPNTLFVYNASVPGAGASYVYDQSVVTSRIYSLAPKEPTLAIFSYGYNWGSPSYRAEILKAVRTFRGANPRSDIVLVSQPPRASSDAGATSNAIRSADVRAVAGQEGFGLIDAYSAFVKYGAYSTDLVSSDGLHPNAAGSDVWAKEALRYLTGTSKVTEPRSAHQSLARVYVPLSTFLASAGSPTLSVVNGLPAWSFDKDANETIVGTFDVPSEWGRVNVYLIWFTSATSGDVKITPRYGNLSFWDAAATGQNAPPSANGGQTIVSASAAANAMRFTRVHPWESTAPVTAPGRLAAGRPLQCTITRDATDAADTLAADVHLVGLVIERVE